MADDSLRSEILVVRERADRIITLAIIYEEGDIGAAVGQLFETPGLRADRSGKPPQLLSTDDTLRTLWVSPSGSVWVASADGNVGTTATVSWTGPQNPGLTYRGGGSTPAWSVTSLAATRTERLPPNVTSLWGTSDSDVHVGTYGGHLYRWDGGSWSQNFDGPGNGKGTIRAFGGHSPADIFAVGRQNTILHFDGSRWTPIRVPRIVDENIRFNGVVNLPTGDVLISGSGDQGILLHGNATNGLTVLGRYPMALIDMAGASGRVLFATGDGVAELFGHDVRMIRSTFKTASMTAGQARWFFIEPAAPRPSFVEYDPQYGDLAWRRYKY